MRLRLAVVFAALVVGAGSAVAATALDGIEIKPGVVNPSVVQTTATFTLTNHSDSYFKTLVLACALLNDSGVPIDTDRVYIDNVKPQSTVYGSADFNNSKSGVKLECRPSSSY